METLIPKYRAWHKKNKKMYRVSKLEWDYVLGEFLIKNDLPQPSILYEYREEIEGCTDQEVEIMQFIGVMDDDGKEIYAGDVVEGILEQTHRDFIGYPGEEEVTKFLVLWDYEGFTWQTLGRHKRYISGVYIENKKIIGNFYENPDLLK